MRDAPSLMIVPELAKQGAVIHAYDPEGMKEAKKLLPIRCFDDAHAAISKADGVVILTEWNEFRALDLHEVKELLTRPLMLDLRNIYWPEEMQREGFEYFSIGRALV